MLASIYNYCIHTYSETIMYLFNSYEQLYSIIVTTASYPLRLIEGPSTSSGRLQVLRDGTWGQVCVTNFNIRDGNVACKQLGYMGIMQVSTNISQLNASKS